MKLFLIALSVGLGYSQVSWERLKNAQKEPQNWLTYSGSSLGQRHSELASIHPGNVKDLELKWVFQAASFEKFEATPLVVDGILYTVQAPNDIVALDAATGRVFWTYSYAPSKESRVCCGRVNRGLAILGDVLFMGTIDARLVAVDAKSGKPIWSTAVARPEAGYSLTHAPLIVKDKVLVGVAGGEYGIRGYIVAYDAKTGKVAYTKEAIPQARAFWASPWAYDSKIFCLDDGGTTHVLQAGPEFKVLGKNSLGGDQTVRGYAFQSLGVRDGEAIVGGRYLVAASAEYTHWLTPEWGAALFYDVGDAADTRKEIALKHGYGVGARWRSPVGTVHLDVAHGRETRKTRLHFSFGFVF